MHPIIFMLTTLTIGTVILMLGIMLVREPGQPFMKSCKECLGWGAGYFICMCAQVAILSAI